MIQPSSPPRRGARFLAVVPLLMLLSACSHPPQRDDVKAALNQELQQAHLGQLLTVDHIDDLQRRREDSAHYAVGVKYTLLAKRGLTAYTAAVQQDPKRGTMDRLAMLMALQAVQQQFGDFKKGDTFAQKRRIDLEKDKDGWHIATPNNTAPPRS